MIIDPITTMFKAESRMNHARDALARATNAHRHACEDVVRYDRAKRLAGAPDAYGPVPNDETNPTSATCRRDPGAVAIRGAGDLLEGAG